MASFFAPEMRPLVGGVMCSKTCVSLSNLISHTLGDLSNRSQTRGGPSHAREQGSPKARKRAQVALVAVALGLSVSEPCSLQSCFARPFPVVTTTGGCKVVTLWACRRGTCDLCNYCNHFQEVRGGSPQALNLPSHPYVTYPPKVVTVVTVVTNCRPSETCNHLLFPDVQGLTTN